MALTDLTRISTSGIATGSTIDAPILRKDVSFRGSQVGVTSALFDSSDDALEFNDNVKLKFGNSGDLAVYHDGTNSVIENTTGDLNLTSTGDDINLSSSDDILLRVDTNKAAVNAKGLGEVILYYNAAPKFATTQSGAVVTGILTATSFSGGISGDTIGNVYAASGISTFYDLRVSNNLTVEGSTTTLDTNLIGVDRVEVGANSNSIVGVAITQSGTADLVNLFDGASQVVTVDDTGKVGIGTDAPTELIDVLKTSNMAKIKVRTTGAGAFFEADSVSSGYHGLILSSGGTERWLMGGYASNNFTIKDGSAASGDERFTIVDGTGKVGINSTSPSERLDVGGNIKASGTITGSSFVGALPISSDGNNRVITATGSGGLNGESTLTYGGNGVLNIMGASGNTQLALFRTDANTTGTTGTIGFYASDNDVVAGLYALGDGDNEGAHLVFKTTTAASGTNPYSDLDERLRITSAGKVGIGEDDPESNHVLIRGSSTVATKSGHIMLTGDSATVGEGPQIVFSESGSGSSYAGAYVGFLRQGSNSIGDLVFGTRGTSGDVNTVPEERLRIDSDGRVLIGSTALAGDATLQVYTADQKHPAIKVNSPNANGFTLLADAYKTDESQVNIGISYSSAKLVLSTSVKPSDTADNTYLSSQDTFNARPCALTISHQGVLQFLNTSTNATTTTDSAVTLTERLSITRDGEMLLGTGGSDRGIAGQRFNSGSGWSGTFQIERSNPNGNNNNVPFLAITAFNGANEQYTGGISFNRSNNNTQGTQGAVNTNQQLGNIAFNGSDGTNFIQGAEIFAIPDQTFATNDGPASLVFATTPDGTSQDEPQERLRIDSSGRIKIGTISNHTQAVTHCPVYIQMTTDLTAASSGEGGANTGLLRIEETGSNANRYHGIELRNRQSGDIRLLNQDVNTSDRGDLVLVMPSGSSSPAGLHTKMRFNSISDSVQIAGKGGAVLANNSTEKTDVYISTKTGVTAIDTGAGSAVAGIIRFEDLGGNNNRYHGIELRNRNSGDVRIFNLDEGATNKSNLVIATDSGSDIVERLRITSNGIMKTTCDADSVFKFQIDDAIGWWNTNTGLAPNSSRTWTITNINYGGARILIGGGDGNYQRAGAVIEVVGTMWANNKSYYHNETIKNSSGASISTTYNNASIEITVASSSNWWYYSMSIESHRRESGAAFPTVTVS